MQVYGLCDAGPRMVGCRSSDGAMQVHTDVQILETETLLGKVGALLENSMLSAEWVAII